MAVVLAFAVVTLVALLALWSSARGAITLCVLEISGGRAEVVKGKLSPKVLSDIRDIVRRPQVDGVTLRLVRARDAARLDVSGNLDKDQRQRLTNLIGNVPLAKLTAGGRARRA